MQEPPKEAEAGEGEGEDTQGAGASQAPSRARTPEPSQQGPGAGAGPGPSAASGPGGAAAPGEEESMADIAAMAGERRLISFFFLFPSPPHGDTWASCGWVECQLIGIELALAHCLS